MPSRTTPRLVGAACVAALALAVGGCGSDPDEVPRAEPTPTATPTPSATPTPLSEYEDEPMVRATRAWLAAVARDVNAGKGELPTASKLSVGQAREVMPGLVDEDLGLRFTGPLPMTPLAVVAKGPVRGHVIACATHNWAIDPKTNKPAMKRFVSSVKYELVKNGNQWLVSSYYESTDDCSGVKVKGVKW